MTVISLHKMVLNILLKRRYPLHWYLDFLVPMKDGLREISIDEKILAPRYKVLPLNDNHAIEIPNDYVDWVSVSARIGQYLQPLVEDNSLDHVPNYDSDFVIQPYSNGVATDSSSTQYTGYYSPYWWAWNWNSYGENLGRQFGGVGVYADTFKVMKERNEIKINESLDVTEIVLEYASDGTDADSASHIDIYAQASLEAYAMWQFKESNRTYSPSEAEVERQKYIDERLKLRARVSDLTITSLKRIAQRNSVAIKY